MHARLLCASYRLKSPPLPHFSFYSTFLTSLPSAVAIFSPRLSFTNAPFYFFLAFSKINLHSEYNSVANYRRDFGLARASLHSNNRMLLVQRAAGAKRESGEAEKRAKLAAADEQHMSDECRRCMSREHNEAESQPAEANEKRIDVKLADRLARGEQRKIDAKLRMRNEKRECARCARVVGA